MSTNSGAGDSNKGCPLPRVSCTSLVKCYAPAIGAASHSFLSINVLNPSLTIGIISKRNLTNALLVGSIVGTGCYLSSRPHLQGSPNRIYYAGFGSIIFSFSSILLWAVLRSFLPNNVAIGSAVGLASSYALLKGGHSYLALVDSQIKK